MKRKIMSLLLTACMVIALLPGSALAAGEASGQDAPPAAPPTEEQTPGQTPGGADLPTPASNGPELQEDFHTDHSVNGSSSGTVWTAWTATSGTTLSGGSYYLTGDVTDISSSIRIEGGTVNLCLNGHTLQGTATDGIIRIGSGGTLNLCDCQGTGELSERSGHNPVFVHSGGTFNLYSGTVTSSITAVVLDDAPGSETNYEGGTVNIYGGTVKSTGSSSQAIKINADLANTAVQISGGTVSGARSVDFASGTVTISGTPTISGPIRLYANCSVTLPSALQTDISVSFYESTSAGRVVAAGTDSYLLTAADMGHISVPGGWYLALTTEQNQIVLTEAAPAHTHPVCGTVDCGHDGHNDVTYTAWNSDSLGEGGYNMKTLSAGSYYLTEDVTLEDDLSISGAVNLCLNGWKLDMGSNHISVSGDAVLTICDCSSGQTGTVTSSSTVISASGALHLYGGSVISTGRYGSEAVSLSSGGSLYMFGGTVNGGGGYAIQADINDSGIVDIRGGTIVSEEAFAIYFTADPGSKLILGGEVSISSGEDSADIYLENCTTNAPITVNELTLPDGEPISVQTFNNAQSGDKLMVFAQPVEGLSAAACAQYFVSAEEGYFVEANGENNIQLTSCAITGQPSESNSYTVAANGSPAYQWYTAVRGNVSVDDSRAEGKDGNYRNGAWSCSKDLGEGETSATFDVFTIDLQKDDVLTVEPVSGAEIDSITMKSGGQPVMAEGSGTGPYTLTAPADGEYTLIVTASPISDGDAGYITVTVTATVSADVTGGAVDGQTAVQLNTTGLPSGRYLCAVTWEGKTTLYSDVVTYQNAQDTPAQGEGYTIDYGAETITIEEGYEVYTAQESGTEIHTGGSISDYWGQPLYIRKGGSGWSKIVLPQRPAKPEVSEPDRDDVTDKTLTIATQTGYQYLLTDSKTPPADWSVSGLVAGDGAPHTFTGLNVDTTYYLHVRKTATGSAPASQVETVTIKTKGNQEQPPETDPGVPSGTDITVTDSSITISGTSDDLEYLVLPVDQTPTESDWEAAKTGTGTNTGLTFENLKPGTSYVIYTRRPGSEDTMPSGAVSIGAATDAAPPSEPIPPTQGSSGSSDSSDSASSYPPAVEDTEHGAVTISPSRPSRGDEVTITPKPDAGYVVDKVTVTDRNGNAVEVTDNGDGTWRFQQPAGRVSVEVTFRETGSASGCLRGDDCPLAQFSDVNRNAWYHDGLHYCLEHGLMVGTSGSAFRPNDSITRGQIVAIFWRLSGSPVVDYAMDFSDVSDGAWYSEAVRWSASEGIIGGYDNGLFGPGDFITREQLAAALYRFAQKQDYDVSVGEDTNILSYADFDQIREYAIPALQWACGAGLINGTSERTLSPRGQTTRAQAAAMLQRFCQYYLGE